MRESQVDVPRRFPTDAEARADLRIRCGCQAADASPRVLARAVERREAAGARIRDQLLQPRPGQVERQATHAADVEAGVVEVQVDAGGRQTADVGVEVVDIARTDPELALRIAVNAA